jgi:outer membrane protein OmpU
MNKITKILLVAFASLTLNATSFAGELSISGSATARYRIDSGDSSVAKRHADKGLGVANEFSLGASGELDNGMSWNYALDLDPDSISGQSDTGDVDADDAKLTLTTDMGTVGVFISEGSLSAKYGWDVSAYGVATDTGNGFGFIHPTNISSFDNVQYHMPADMLPYGITGQIAYSPSGSTQYSSGGSPTLNAGATAYDATEYKVTAAPIDGLSIGANYFEVDNNSTESSKEGGAWYAKYAYGPVTIGYGKAYMTNDISTLTDAYAAAQDTALAGYESVENTSYGIGFAVNDDLSLSWTSEESNPDAQTAATATYTMEITSIQLAYSMGGMTLSLSQDSAENSDYVQNQDEKETLVSVSMAF